MNKCWGLSLGLGMLAVFLAACSVEGDGDENPPSYKTYAYARSANGIYAFSANTNTGALTEVPGSPFTDGEVPSFIALEPSGKFAYVANESSASISIFAINAATGAMTPLTGSPFVAWSGPRCVAVDPLGRFLYMAVSSGGSGFGGSVAAYTIDTATGLLTEVAGSPYIEGIWPVYVAIHPSGKFAYVAYSSQEVVTSFEIDAATGAIKSISSINATEWTGCIAIHPSGKFAYVMSRRSIGTRSIDADTGKLTPVSSGGLYYADATLLSFAVHPSGLFAYMAGMPNPVSAPAVTAISIDTATGRLTEVAVLPIANGWHNVAIDPSGKFLYVSGSGNKVFVFAVDPATGMLTELAGSPLTIRESLGRLEFIRIAQ